ncbi:hypothetical protein LY78DRAFT_687498 [Colletotrichum sublineola]|nr:hypothetical protein LY78DRAFT_687498 [Colletotrichum sublineola]
MRVSTVVIGLFAALVASSPVGTDTSSNSVDNPLLEARQCAIFCACSGFTCCGTSRQCDCCH